MSNNNGPFIQEPDDDRTQEERELDGIKWAILHLNYKPPIQPPWPYDSMTWEEYKKTDDYLEG